MLPSGAMLRDSRRPCWIVHVTRHRCGPAESIGMRFLIAFCAFLLAPAAHAQDRATLDAVSLHLFLTKSGTLSRDVSANFSSWNFAPEGEGIPEGERFYAMLVRVRLTAPREVFAKGTQAEVVVTNRETRKVVKRERIANVYIGSEGWTFAPVFVPDAACGPFDIVVTGGAKKIAKALEAKCGE
jgi:hypothetical protein